MTSLEQLPEGILPADRQRGDGVVVLSLTAHGMAAADRHRWIESEKSGYDLGDHALRDWVRRHWKGYARARLMEHLYGWRCWGAFDEDDFGLFKKHTVEHHVPRAVLVEVARILGNGGENLDVIAWALANQQELDPILWLLDRIDINAKRQRLLTAHFEQFLPS
jgi:hypothetical protein